jgi:Holin of 3TMs, for gene-transfer release
MGLLSLLSPFNLGDVGGLFTSLREAITGKKIEDPTELAKINEQLDALENALMTGQMEINKQEAASTNWFVAGWRPFIGWVCGAAFAYTYVFLPFSQFLVFTFGNTEMINQLNLLPKLDLGVMMPVLLGMLGLGGMRSFEKSNGSQNNH